MDTEGVALAAIQGVYAELKQRDARIADQQREIAELRERMAQLESLRGDLAALRNTIAGVTKASQVAAQAE